MRKNRILAQVENSEFLRERARLAARQAFDDIDAANAIGDPDGEADRIAIELAVAVALLVQQAADSALQHAQDMGLSGLDQGMVDEVVQQTLEEIHADSQGAIKARIESALQKVGDAYESGVSEDTIAKMMESEKSKDALLAGLLAVMTQTASGYIAEVEQRIAGLSAASFAAANTSSLIQWDAVGDGNSCDDVIESSCAPRDGQRKTFSEWQGLGLPGAPNLICSIYSKSGHSNCRCSLTSAAEPRQEPGVIDTADAIKAGRARANGT